MLNSISTITIERRAGVLPKIFLLKVPLHGVCFNDFGMCVMHARHRLRVLCNKAPRAVRLVLSIDAIVNNLYSNEPMPSSERG